MKVAIIVFILIGILDTMLIIACAELEKREEREKRNGKIH